MASPGFEGGIKLQAALSYLQKAVGDHQVVRVGFLEGATCGRDNDASAPEIAFILEGGAPAANIPPRPFFRTMISKRSQTWGKTLTQLLKNNSYDTRLALMGMGMIMGEQLQVSMIQMQDPPNAPSTIKAKGFNNPLIDSRNLLRSIEAEVGGERQSLNSADVSRADAQLANIAGKSILKGV